MDKPNKECFDKECMMNSGALSACTTAETITLYWDKTGAPAGQGVYEVWADSCLRAEVFHTHCTLTDLQPDTVYDVKQK